MGLLAGRFAAAERHGTAPVAPPPTTALGALLNHVTAGHIVGETTFQPMNVNYGLFPPLAAPEDGARRGPKGRARKEAMSLRALADLDAWQSVSSESGCHFSGSETRQTNDLDRRPAAE
jgi:methylenetetrahydrofolate--tRNA-(uracil-5-)-methyltransferase